MWTESEGSTRSDVEPRPREGETVSTAVLISILTPPTPHRLLEDLNNLRALPSPIWIIQIHGAHDAHFLPFTASLRRWVAKTSNPF